MLNLLFITLFTFFIFFLALVGYKKFFSTALYCIAIGGVVNSIYFSSTYVPIDVLGIKFGLNPVLISVCLFAVCLMFIEFGQRQAIYLTISLLLAILFSALTETVGACLSRCVNEAFGLKMISIGLTFASMLIASVVMLLFMNFINKKHKLHPLVLLPLTLLLGTLTKTFFYSPAYVLTHKGELSSIPNYSLYSSLLKLISLILSKE